MNRNNATTSEPLPIVTQKEPREPRDHVEPPKQSYWRLLPRNLPEILLTVGVVLMIFLQLRYLWSVRTTVPHQDDWNYLDKMFRALDRRQVAGWIFDSTNGHFVVPGALAYFISWRYFSLDLTGLRLMSFPICIVSFLLMVRVINGHITTRFLRFYLYTGASLVIFSLCFWEHFAQASGFSAMLSALFGGVGVYFAARALQSPAPWKTYPFLIGLLFLLVSTLSLGAGYAAVAAVVSLFALSILKGLAASRKIPKYNVIMTGMVCALGILAIVSHPIFNLKSRLVKGAFHAVLVAGSVGSASLEKYSLLAQNVAFGCGLLLIVMSLSIALHFLAKSISRNQLLPVFSMGLVLFGLFGCVAVASGRAYLPNAEFLNSRYTLYPSITLLGALLYFAWSRVFLLSHIWCFAAAVYLLATIKEHQVGFFRARLYQQFRTAITTSDYLSDEDLKARLYWRENTKGVRRVIARMRRDQSNVFRHGPGKIDGSR